MEKIIEKIGMKKRGRNDSRCKLVREGRVVLVFACPHSPKIAEVVFVWGRNRPTPFLLP
jgi:hypothetical protein